MYKSQPPATVPTPAAPATAAPVQAAQSTGLEGTLVFQTGQGGAIYAYDLATGEQWPLTTGFDPAISLSLIHISEPTRQY